MLNDLLCFFRYYRNPRYVVMKGLSIENRALMFVGANPTFKKDEYGSSVVTFTNHDLEYYPSNIYKRIWTFKELMRWRRLLGKGPRCVQCNYGQWSRV